MFFLMTGKKFSFLIFLFLPAFAFAQPADSTNASSSGDEPLPFLNADFFADSLSEAYTLEEDPMGAQRLLQVRDSALTPSVVISSTFLHSDNFLSVNDEQLQSNKADGMLSDAYSLNLSLNFTLGLGEYGLGDDIILTPKLNFIRGRSFTDPFRDYGSTYSKDRSLNNDSLVANISIPFILPNEFSLSFGHTYSSINYYRGVTEEIMHVNVPNISFEKKFILDNGDELLFNTQVSYSFNKTASENDAFDNPELAALGLNADFLRTAFFASNPGTTLQDIQRTDTSDTLSHNISLSYSKMITENFSITPMLNFISQNYTEGKNQSRSSKSYGGGVSFGYTLLDWLSINANSMFTKLKTRGLEDMENKAMSFESFSNAISINVQHSF